MNRIQQLTSDAAFVRSALDEITAEVGDEIMSDDQQARWDEGMSFVRDAKTKIDRAEVLEAERAEAAALVKAFPAAAVSGDGASFNISTVTSESPYDLTTVDRSKNWDSELVARAMSIAETGEGWGSDDHREGATKTIQRLGNENSAAEQIIVSASPAYRSAFLKHARNSEAPGTAEVSGEEAMAMRSVDQILNRTGFWTGVNAGEARALALTNVTGKLVPAQLDTSIILTNDGVINPFRAISRVVQIATNVWTGVSTAGVTAEWTGVEGTEVADASPTFANPAVTAFMADAFIPISFQGYEDWSGAASELELLINDAKDHLEAAAFATGSGSNQPMGIVTELAANTNVQIHVTTNGVFGVQDMFALKEALGPRWKPGASYVSNEAYLDRVRQFGTANTYYAFTVDLTGDLSRVLNKPWYQSSSMTSTLSTATNNAVVYGDFSQYLIADRIGLALEFIPNLFGKTNGRPIGQRGWLAHWRTGAAPLVDTAFRILQTK